MKFIKLFILIILGLIYTLLYHFAIFSIFYFFFNIKFTISLIIILGLFVFHLIIAFILFNAINSISQEEISKSPANERVTNLYNDIINKNINKYPKLKKIQLITFTNKDKLLAKYSFGSPGVASLKKILINSTYTGTYFDYEIPGVICHELGHINSGITFYLFLINTINFFPAFLGKMFFSLSRTFSYFLNSSKIKVLKYLYIIPIFITYVIAFLINLPYNLFFSYFHLSEEKYSDLFTTNLGYGYSLKYFFTRNYIPFKDELISFLIYPQHPFMKKRIKYINESLNLKPELIDYHIIDNTLFAYTGKENKLIIPSFIKQLGDGSKPILETSTIKEIITTNQVNIASKSFMNSSINSITINDTIKEIGAYSFWNCKKINEIIINGKKPLIINDNAFFGCSNLTKIDLSNVIKIGKYSFANTSLTTIIFPLKLQEIYSSSFNKTNLSLKEDEFGNQYFNDFIISLKKTKDFFIYQENMKLAKELDLTIKDSSIKYVDISKYNDIFFTNVIENKLLIISKNTDSSLLPNSFITNNINDVKDYMILLHGATNIDELINDLKNINSIDEIINKFI